VNYSNPVEPTPAAETNVSAMLKMARRTTEQPDFQLGRPLSRMIEGLTGPEEGPTQILDRHAILEHIAKANDADRTSRPRYTEPRRIPDSQFLLALEAESVEAAETHRRALESFPEPGEKFLGFELVSELSRDALGARFLATHPVFPERPMVVAIQSDVLDSRPAHLHHTNVAPVLAAYSIDSLHATCSPYYGNVTLGEVVAKNESLSAAPAFFDVLIEAPAAENERPARRPVRGADFVESVLWLGMRIASALGHAHARSITHQELAPSKILLSDDGEPLVTDFDFARRPTALHAAAAKANGALPYLAPEALLAMKSGQGGGDPRSDLYSLGAILFQLLTRRRPLGNSDSHEQRALPRAREACASIPRDVDAILAKCLEVEPANRYQHAEELETDLRLRADRSPLRYAKEATVDRLTKQLGRFRRF
jgi:hypothetical protein